MNVNMINMLIVDDDRDFARLINIKMSKEPASARFNIKTVSSLTECFETLETFKADIVLLDLGLPETQGLETIDKFCQQCPDIPVIVMTSNKDQDIGIESIKKGASAFIEKTTFDSKILIRTALHSLERNDILKQLKVERQNARDYLELAGVIIVSVDDKQNITMVNKAACKLLGYREESLIGKNWFDICSPAGKKEKLKEKFASVISGRQNAPALFETVVVSKNGNHSIISWNTKFITDNNGCTTGILGSGIDVTAQKISKRKLKKINKEIMLHDIQKSEFIINISHELRTPLTIFKNIISNALAGTSGKLTPKLEKELMIGDKAIDRLARIITDFLDISKIEAGKINLDYENIDVNLLIKDSIDTHKMLIDSNYMAVEIISPDHPVVFMGDYQRMMQILGKLIENAAKFVPDCGGQMIVRVKDMENSIGIDIEDNGPGIEGPDINRVFNRFIQIKRHVGEGEHGTGLGLAVTKELVEMHNGRIWVENKPSGGTVFKMVIPKKPQTTNEEPEFNSRIEEAIDSLAGQAKQLNDEICSEYYSENDTQNVQLENEKIIDWDLAIKYCGEEKVVKRIAKSIVDDAPEQMDALIQAVQRQNSKDTVYTAHKLKGAIQTIGATALPEVAQAIETAAGEDDFYTVDQNMPILQTEYDKLMSLLKHQDWTTLAKASSTQPASK